VSFLKFSRDRRGYEHFYLVEPVTGRRGKTRQRVLYWFRTPPNVKVGREPFDAHVMRALEARYPGVKFDWEQLRHTPIPSVEPEYWRERRRAERAVRRQQEDEDAQAVAAEPPSSEPVVTDLVPEDLPEPPGADRGLEAPAGLQSGVDSSDGAASRGGGREGPGSRRRRRRRRGPRSPTASGPPVAGEPPQTESSAAASIDANEVVDDEPVDRSDE
jgi:hypothetical protein